jgi:hypothetical protein
MTDSQGEGGNQDVTSTGSVTVDENGKGKETLRYSHFVRGRGKETRWMTWHGVRVLLDQPICSSPV